MLFTTALLKTGYSRCAIETANEALIDIFFYCEILVSVSRGLQLMGRTKH